MNLDVSKASLIGLDWGTSSLRAYLINAQGDVLDQLSSANGIMKVPDKNFEDVCQQTLDPWLQNNNLPIIASGMITSRNGWLETPYASLPASAEQLAGALVPLHSESLRLNFVTGIATEHSGAPDVIRGEETQIVGVMNSGISDATLVMPGTHSKWVTVRAGLIEEFSTYMSGELFEVLGKHTILGTLMKEGEFSETSFREGVKQGMDAGSKLLHTLFRARTLPLFKKMKEEEVADFLSGMLIGAEINGATAGQLTEDPVIIVGSGALTDRYAIAFEVIGQKYQSAAPDVVAQGHFAIARSAGLLS